MLFFVKVLVSGFRTPFTLHQVPETSLLNGGMKEFVYYKKKQKNNWPGNRDCIYSGTLYKALRMSCLTPSLR